MIREQSNALFKSTSKSTKVTGNINNIAFESGILTTSTISKKFNTGCFDPVSNIGFAPVNMEANLSVENFAGSLDFGRDYQAKLVDKNGKVLNCKIVLVEMSLAANFTTTSVFIVIGAIKTLEAAIAP